MSGLDPVLSAWRAAKARVPFLGRLALLLRKPWYVAIQSIYRDGVPIRFPDGRTAKVHPRLLGMQPALYEPELTRLIKENARAGSTVVDIGAHVGLHTLALSDCVGPSGQVIAVEPSPANAALLRFHIEANRLGNVRVIEALVADRIDAVAFSFRDDPTDPAGFANSLAYDIGGRRIVLPMTNLDSICQDTNPSLIKIDVEGAELLVLRGAAGLLTRAAPVLIVAVHPDPMRMLGTSPGELVQFLEMLGYLGTHLDGRQCLDPGFEEIIFRKSGDVCIRAAAEGDT